MFDSWHWCQNCTYWPNVAYVENDDPPGDTCSECRGLHIRGRCDRLLDQARPGGERTPAELAEAASLRSNCPEVPTNAADAGRAARIAILIVAADFRGTLIPAALMLYGYDVRCAIDVLHARDLIARHNPAVVLVEYPSELRAGFDFLNELQPLRAARGLLVVVLLAPAAALLGAFHSMADLAFTNPVPPRLIAESIELCIRDRGAGPQ